MTKKKVYNFALTSNELSDYVRNNRDLIFTDLLMPEDLSAFALLDVEPGCYPSKNVPDFSGTSLVYNDGSDLSITGAQGSDTIKDVTISASRIGIIKSFNAQQLDRSIAKANIAAANIDPTTSNIDPEELAYSEVFLDLNIRQMIQDNNMRLWQGDTDSASTILSRFDGYHKRLANAAGDDAPIASGTAIPAGGYNDSNIVASVLEVADAISSSSENLEAAPQVRGQAPEVYMSIANLQLFIRNFTGVTTSVNRDNFVEGFTNTYLVPGRNVILIGFPQFGNGNQIYGTRPSNFIIPTDFEDSTEALEFFYSTDQAKHYLRGAFALGSAIRRTAEVVVKGA